VETPELRFLSVRVVAYARTDPHRAIRSFRALPMILILYNIIFEEFLARTDHSERHGVQWGLKRAYSEGHTTLSLRLF